MTYATGSLKRFRTRKHPGQSGSARDAGFPCRYRDDCSLLQKKTIFEVGWNRQLFVIPFKEETPHIFMVSASSLPIFSV